MVFNNLSQLPDDIAAQASRRASSRSLRSFAFSAQTPIMPKWSAQGTPHDLHLDSSSVIYSHPDLASSRLSLRQAARLPQYMQAALSTSPVDSRSFCCSSSTHSFPRPRGRHSLAHSAQRGEQPIRARRSFCLCIQSRTRSPSHLSRGRSTESSFAAEPRSMRFSSPAIAEMNFSNMARFRQTSHRNRRSLCFFFEGDYFWRVAHCNHQSSSKSSVIVSQCDSNTLISA